MDLPNSRTGGLQSVSDGWQCVQARRIMLSGAISLTSSCSRRYFSWVSVGLQVFWLGIHSVYVSSVVDVLMLLLLFLLLL